MFVHLNLASDLNSSLPVDPYPLGLCVDCVNVKSKIFIFFFFLLLTVLVLVICLYSIYRINLAPDTEQGSLDPYPFELISNFVKFRICTWIESFTVHFLNMLPVHIACKL
jgi:hypothetical protein